MTKKVKACNRAIDALEVYSDEMRYNKYENGVVPCLSDLLVLCQSLDCDFDKMLEEARKKAPLAGERYVLRNKY